MKYVRYALLNSIKFIVIGLTYVSEILIFLVLLHGA